MCFKVSTTCSTRGLLSILDIAATNMKLAAKPRRVTWVVWVWAVGLSFWLACCLRSGSPNQADLLFESETALSADPVFAGSTAPVYRPACFVPKFLMPLCVKSLALKLVCRWCIGRLDRFVCFSFPWSGYRFKFHCESTLQRSGYVDLIYSTSTYISAIE